MRVQPTANPKRAYPVQPTANPIRAFQVQSKSTDNDRLNKFSTFNRWPAKYPLVILIVSLCS